MKLIIDTHTESAPAMTGGYALMMAVLVQDGIGKYRCYLAIVDGPTGRCAQWAADFGRKMTEAEAKRWFPVIKDGEYAP